MYTRLVADTGWRTSGVYTASGGGEHVVEWRFDSLWTVPGQSTTQNRDGLSTGAGGVAAAQ